MSIDSSAAKAMLRGVTDIVSFPEVALRINQMVQSQTSNARQIGKKIEAAPDIAAGILRLANCAIYAFPKEIDTIHRAITLVGDQAVRDIVLALSTKSALKGIKSRDLDINYFWRHSLHCAALARELAARDGGVDTDSIFTAGLLHDIGRLVLFRQKPELALELQQECQENPHQQLHELELEALGFHHGTLGGLLAQRWQFPEKLVCCILNHHSPFQAASEFRQEVRLVHLADTLTPLLDQSNIGLDELVIPFPGMLAEHGLDEESLTQTVASVRESMAELRQVFDITA